MAAAHFRRTVTHFFPTGGSPLPRSRCSSYLVFLFPLYLVRHARRSRIMRSMPVHHRSAYRRGKNRETEGAEHTRVLRSSRNGRRSERIESVEQTEKKEHSYINEPSKNEKNTEIPNTRALSSFLFFHQSPSIARLRAIQIETSDRASWLRFWRVVRACVRLVATTWWFGR